jgi:hypothetical protein
LEQNLDKPNEDPPQKEDCSKKRETNFWLKYNSILELDLP